MTRRSIVVHSLLLFAIHAAAAAGGLPALQASFKFEGPSPVLVVFPPSSPSVVAGAIQAIAIEPGNTGVVWIGSVNGGVWKTSDFHADDAGHPPDWKPLTDRERSLSIAALSLDPIDKKFRTVVAAIGATSSAGGASGPLLGVLRTTDGGSSWTLRGEAELSGQDLTGVAARAETIVVTSKSATGGGVWRSTDAGASFTHLGASAGVPGGAATALAVDPGHSERLWAGFVGAGGGVFFSHDDGKTWSRITNHAFDVLAASATAIRLDAQSYAGGVSTVYAAIVDPKPPPPSTASNVPAIFRFTQVSGGAVTFAIDNLQPLPAFETLDQGKVAIAADPLRADQFFVGGDEGKLFRCEQPLGPFPFPMSCTPISDSTFLQPRNTGIGTKPHADSRAMAFHGDHALIATDDGGVYLRTRPREDSGDWFAKIGNLGATEAYSCAYDDHAKIIFCGTQDNGPITQAGTGVTTWTQLDGRDGGSAAASDGLLPCPFNPRRNCSSRYFSQQKLRHFTRLDCDAGNACEQTGGAVAEMLKLGGATIGCTAPSDPTTCGDGGVSELTPLAANRFNPHRLVVATTVVYESTDGGRTVKKLKGLDGPATSAILFGGEHGHSRYEDLIYVGSPEGPFARTGTGDLKPTGWNMAHGTPEGIAIDPDDFQSVWLTTGRAVWHGTGVTTGHESWDSITGDLASDADVKSVRPIVFIGTGTPRVIVGADDGLYTAATATSTGPTKWFKLHGALPNAAVRSLSYSRRDDKLVIGTLGRSVWSVSNASKL